MLFLVSFLSCPISLVDFLYLRLENLDFLFVAFYHFILLIVQIIVDNLLLTLLNVFISIYFVHQLLNLFIFCQNIVF